MNYSRSTATCAPFFGRMSPLFSPRVQRFAPPLVLFFLALVAAWMYDPLHHTLYEDPGIFALLSQLVAQGFAPHQTVFNEQASLTYLAGGAAMWLGNLVPVHPLISFRILSMLVMGGIVVLTYALGKIVTGSAFVGFVAGLILVSFQGYVARAATALEPKSLMLLFGLSALCFLSQRKWFAAGAMAGAAGLAWQIAWGYLIVALILAAVQGGTTWQARVRAFLVTLGAALAVFAVYLAFFVAHHAQVEMLQQTFIAPLLMHDGARQPFFKILVKLARAFYNGYGIGWVFPVLGVGGFVLWLDSELQGQWRRGGARHLTGLAFQNPRTAGTLLVIGGFVLFTFIDFQSYPDWIPLLPFIAIFAACFLSFVYRYLLRRVSLSPSRTIAGWIGLGLVVFLFGAFQTAMAVRAEKAITWQDQQQVADQISRQISPDAPIWLVYKPELLFFMKRQNLNKYIYLLGRVDAAIDAFEPGGFDAMIQNAQNQNAVLYALNGLKSRKFATKAHVDLVKHMFKGFVPLVSCPILGDGKFYAPNAQTATLFPTDKSFCLHR